MRTKKLKAALIIIVSLFIVFFIYVKEGNLGFDLHVTNSARTQNNFQISRVVSEIDSKPELMAEIMNGLNKINNVNARRAIAISDSITGIKDTHYMLLRMLYSSDR